MSDDLGEAMKFLAPELRQALEMTKIRELTTESAAKELGISPPALRKRVSRAIQALRGSLLAFRQNEEGNQQ